MNELFQLGIQPTTANQSIAPWYFGPPRFDLDFSIHHQQGGGKLVLPTDQFLPRLLTNIQWTSIFSEFPKPDPANDANLDSLQNPMFFQAIWS